VSAFGGARVVVTGSAGFIGTHLVRELDLAGATVTGLDRRPPSFDSPGAHLHLDLLAPVAGAILRDVLGSADLVFHLAARPGVRATGPTVEEDRRRDNVDAGRVVLGLTPLDVPIVVSSSSSVYGGARSSGLGVRPSRETDPLAPRGGYARSKAALEALCHERAVRGGVVAVARPFTVSGDGQRPDMALSRWLRAGAEGRPLEVLGSLARARDVTDVHDVVRGLLALGQRGETVTVNLGTGRPCTLAELVDAVAAALGRPVDLRIGPAGEEEPAVTRADTTRCRQVCGFVPRADLTALVRRQWDSLRLAVAA
jgi:nucleoside-diphosphate-sugar epimerase